MSLFTQKTLKFDYYRVVFVPKSSKKGVIERPYDLQTLIDKWDNMSHKERTCILKQERARLETWGYLEEVNLYHLQFCKLTVDDLPSLAKEDEPTRPMELDEDEYLGSKVSAIYDSEKKCFLKQKIKFLMQRLSKK